MTIVGTCCSIYFLLDILRFNKNGIPRPLHGTPSLKHAHNPKLDGYPRSRRRIALLLLCSPGPESVSFPVWTPKKRSFPHLPQKKKNKKFETTERPPAPPFIPMEPLETRTPDSTGPSCSRLTGGLCARPVRWKPGQFRFQVRNTCYNQIRTYSLVFKSLHNGRMHNFFFFFWLKINSLTRGDCDGAGFPLEGLLIRRNPAGSTLEELVSIRSLLVTRYLACSWCSIDRLILHFRNWW